MTNERKQTKRTKTICVIRRNRAHLSTFVSIFPGHENTQVSTDRQKTMKWKPYFNVSARLRSLSMFTAPRCTLPVLRAICRERNNSDGDAVATYIEDGERR